MLKNILNIVLLMALFSLFGCSKTTYQGYNLKDFNHYSSTRKVLSYTIDTRSKEDYENGHLPHAHNIPFSKDFMNDLTSFLKDKNTPKSLLLFIYGDTKEITENQKNEIKQELKFYRNYKFISINYLTEDFRYPIE